MKRFLRSLIWICPALALTAPHCARAQFGAVPQPAGAAPAAAAPAGEVPKATDPRVEALLATNPQTAEDLFGVVMLLVDLKHPEVAKPLFTKLVEALVDEVQLASFGRNVGITKLYPLGQIKEFQPQSGEFIKRVVAATNAANRDPQRIAEQIERLKKPSLSERAAAVMALRTGGDAAVLALVDVLADPARSAEHRTVAEALAAVGSEGLGPLEIFAANGNEVQRVLALQTLGFVEDAGADAALYAAAFGSKSSPAVKAEAEASIRRKKGALPKPAEAAAELYLAAKHHYLTKLPADVVAAKAPVWSWNEATKKPALKLVAPLAQALDRAASLACAAADISGNDPQALILARAAKLDAVLNTVNSDAEAMQQLKDWQAAEKLSVAELESLLEFTSSHQHDMAAGGAVFLLAGAAGPRALESVGGKPSVLVRMTMQPSRRLRFAALHEILKLNPAQSFAGSSAVADALGYFASAGGVRKALVVDSSPARAHDIAGLAAGLGYQAETASDARTAVRMVSADADYELVLMYRPFMTPELGQLLAQLRADYRTARLPVAVYAEPDDVERVRSLLSNDEWTAGIYQPRSPEALTRQLSDLERPSFGVGGNEIERIHHARSAILAIGKLAESKSKVFSTRSFEPVLLAAAWNPALSMDAVSALGWFGSAAAQRTLVDLASAGTWPLDLRQQAAKVFCESVIRHGTLLTTSEITRQYERYNASAALDRPTQELLGAVLDAIESRVAKLPARVAAGGPVRAPSAPPPPAETVPKNP